MKRARKLVAGALTLVAVAALPFVATAATPDSGPESYEPYYDDDPGSANIITDESATVLSGVLDVVPESESKVGDKYEIVQKGWFVNNTGTNTHDMDWVVQAQGTNLANITTADLPSAGTLAFYFTVVRAISTVTAVSGDQVTLSTILNVNVSAPGSAGTDISENTTTPSAITVDDTGGIAFDMEVALSVDGNFPDHYYNPDTTSLAKRENEDLEQSGVGFQVAWDNDVSVAPGDTAENTVFTYVIPEDSVPADSNGANVTDGGQQWHMRTWGTIDQPNASRTLNIRLRVNGTTQFQTGEITVDPFAGERPYVVDWYARKDNDESLNMEAIVTVGSTLDTSSSTVMGTTELYNAHAYRRGQDFEDAWTDDDITFTVSTDWSAHTAGQVIERHGFRVERWLTQPG